MKMFSIFTFIKLIPEFKRLQSNEKISLKQEFEDSIANSQEKIFLRSYFVSGLKEDCDLMLWRMHQSIDYLQNICARNFSTGLGKYIEIKYSYLGIKDFKEDGFEEINRKLGIYPYLLLHPLNKSNQWYELTDQERENLINQRKEIIKAYPKMIENFFISFGIDDQDMIVVRESQSIEDLIEATARLKRMKSKSFTLIDKPVFLCIGKDLRDILDNIS